MQSLQRQILKIQHSGPNGRMIRRGFPAPSGPSGPSGPSLKHRKKAVCMRPRAAIRRFLAAKRMEKRRRFSRDGPGGRVLRLPRWRSTGVEGERRFDSSSVGLFKEFLGDFCCTMHDTPNPSARQKMRSLDQRPVVAFHGCSSQLVLRLPVAKSVES